MKMVQTQVIELNVGGHVFTTLRSTLCKHADSMLGKMFSGDFAPAHQDNEGRYFIDRDGTHFGIVLAYLREQPMKVPRSYEERAALTAEAAFYQLQGLQDMLSLGQEEDEASCPSKLSFADLGKLHISEGRALLMAEAKARIGQAKLFRICEALTRFHFGERGTGSSSHAAMANHAHIQSAHLFTSLTADVTPDSVFHLHKQYVGYGGETVGYTWSAVNEPAGYAGCWKLDDIAKSPSLVDIDADEFVHLVYTYATLFQAEMEARGLTLKTSIEFNESLHRAFCLVSIKPSLASWHQ